MGLDLVRGRELVYQGATKGEMSFINAIREKSEDDVSVKLKRIAESLSKDESDQNNIIAYLRHKVERTKKIKEEKKDNYRDDKDNQLGKLFGKILSPKMTFLSLENKIKKMAEKEATKKIEKELKEEQLKAFKDLEEMKKKQQEDQRKALEDLEEMKKKPQEGQDLPLADLKEAVKNLEPLDPQIPGDVEEEEKENKDPAAVDPIPAAPAPVDDKKDPVQDPVVDAKKDPDKGEGDINKKPDPVPVPANPPEKEDPKPEAPKNEAPKADANPKTDEERAIELGFVKKDGSLDLEEYFNVVVLAENDNDKKPEEKKEKKGFTEEEKAFFAKLEAEKEEFDDKQFERQLQLESEKQQLQDALELSRKEAEKNKVVKDVKKDDIKKDDVKKDDVKKDDVKKDVIQEKNVKEKENEPSCIRKILRIIFAPCIGIANFFKWLFGKKEQVKKVEEKDKVKA